MVEQIDPHAKLSYSIKKDQEIKAEPLSHVGDTPGEQELIHEQPLLAEEDQILKGQDALMAFADKATLILGKDQNSPSSGAASLTLSPNSSPKDQNSQNPRRAVRRRKEAHTVSEQKRRQNINDGFEDLRRLIPNCQSKVDSKAVILRKAALYIQQLHSEMSKCGLLENTEPSLGKRIRPVESTLSVSSPSSSLSNLRSIPILPHTRTNQISVKLPPIKGSKNDSLNSNAEFSSVSVLARLGEEHPMSIKRLNE